MIRFVALSMLLIHAAPQSALADSPSADEFPFWPASVKWSPKSTVKTCSPSDIARPHGQATWDAQFTSCVYTLAYFDTCASDACVDAFSASSKQALNCSYDGKVGTAQEVETNRLQRCAAARKVQSDRYVPDTTPAAPQCTSAQLTTWDANYNQNAEYQTCYRSLVTTRGVRSCSDYCQRVFHDAVSDAGECLFSPQAGAVTQHEWLKHLLVWCLMVRGDDLRSDPLLFVKGTSSPSPTTPKPTTPEPTTVPPSQDSSAGDDVETPKPTKPKRNSSSSDSSHGSQAHSVGSDESDTSIILDDASEDDDTTLASAVSPSSPGRPTYGNAPVSSDAVVYATPTEALAVAVAITGAVLAQLR